MIELTKFAAKTKVSDAPDVVSINKSGVLRIGVLASERIGLTVDSYVNCYFDKNDKTHIYLLVSKYDQKRSSEGYKPTKSNLALEDSSFMFNLGSFMKRVEFSTETTRAFTFDIINIKGTDYIRINLENSTEEREEEENERQHSNN